MFKKSIIIICSLFFNLAVQAQIDIETSKKSWIELAPSQDAFEGGMVTILVSIADYVDFNIAQLTSTDKDLESRLKAENCVTWNQSLKLTPKCLIFLKNDFPDTFENLTLEYLEYYDFETPSYDVQMKSSEYQKLIGNFVLKRLGSIVDEQTPAAINPVKFLNADVAEALWTVPGDDANCFGTAYAAVTPGSKLRYRDYLWSNPSPEGYLKSTIDDAMVFGDLIEFEIPGDGHATVYLGTDQEGDMIVLTKNGFMPSVVQVMKYKDVYKVYEPYNITQVNVWRPDPNAAFGFAGTTLATDMTDFKSMINTRKNSVTISVDESIAIKTAKGFSKWMNRAQ